MPNGLRCLRLAMAIVWLMPAVAGAGTAGTIVLPNGGPQNYVAGLRLYVHSDWVQGYGHRPVQVELRAQRAESEVRSVTVELALDDYSNQSMIASTVLELPAGETRASCWVPVPQLPRNQMLSVRTLAGGYEIEALTTNSALGNLQHWDGGTGIPRILFVADAAPDISGFRFFAQPPYLAYGNVTFNRLQDVFAFAHLPAAKLFEEPIFYSALDMIFMSRDDAEQLAASAPKVWQAIGWWVRSGGLLLLYGVEHDEAGLSAAEILMRSPATEQQATLPRRGWEAPRQDFYAPKMTDTAQAVAATTSAPQVTSPAAEAGNAATAEAGDETAVEVAGAMAEQADAAETVAADSPFLWRSMGLGYVVAWRHAQPFPGDELEWRWLMEALPDGCSNWVERHGANPDAASPEFNEFLIADVGLPPIRSYKWLITAFVVLIGPVNYWLLRRYERLYLFLFTVPLAALVTTGGLLGYALLSDGLQSRLRTLSFTVLDQRVQQAATSARLSYYVGMTPAAGFTFPRDTQVTPLELEPAYYLSGNARRRVAWDDAQRLTRGWITSRTPTQLVTQRAYRCTHSLVFASPRADGQRQVTNNLGVRMRQLLVCDERGRLLVGGAIDAGQQGSLAERDSEDQRAAAVVEFLKVFDKHAPALPPAMDPYASQGALRWFGMRPAVLGGQKQFGGSAGGVELRLKELRTTISSLALEPRTYVAIVDRPAEVVVGLDELLESQSTHVILGQW